MSTPAEKKIILGAIERMLDEPGVRVKMLRAIVKITPPGGTEETYAIGKGQRVTVEIPCEPKESFVFHNNPLLKGAGVVTEIIVCDECGGTGTVPRNVLRDLPYLDPGQLLETREVPCPKCAAPQILREVDALITRTTNLALRDVLPTLQAMRDRLEGAVDGVTEAMERG